MKPAHVILNSHTHFKSQIYHYEYQDSTLINLIISWSHSILNIFMKRGSLSLVVKKKSFFSEPQNP